MNNPHKIKGFVFDDNAEIVVVDNIEIFVTELKDELLIKTFGSTLYNHMLLKIQEELVNNGMMKKLKGGPYNSAPTEAALVCMMEEIKLRFDDDHENYYENNVIESIDFRPIKNIPKDLDFLNKVKNRLFELNLIPKNL